MTRRIAALVAMLAAGGVAKADPLPVFSPAAEQAPIRETRWYGWQIMLADAASGAMMYVGAQTDNEALAAAGFALFFVAPPVIHLAHGAPGDAGKSFLFRAAPLALGLAIAAVAVRGQDCAEGCAALFPAFFGAVGSGVGAIADWAFLSTEQVEAPRLSLGPALPLDHRRGGGLALALRF